MRSYWDLTPSERIALTQDQLNEVWIPREAAMKGLLVPSKPVLFPLPEKPDVNEPSQTPAFKVIGNDSRSGNYDFSCIFNTLEDAKAFIAMRPVGFERKYRPNYETFNIERRFTSYEVEIINLVDEQEQLAYTAAMKEYEEAKKANDKLTEDYERDIRAINNSAERLRNNLSKLQNRKAELEGIIFNLKEFIKVAEGDFKMACKFMLKKVDRQLLYDALQEYSEAEGFVWETVEIFGGDCLIEDLNPFRDIDPEGRTTL